MPMRHFLLLVLGLVGALGVGLLLVGSSAAASPEQTGQERFVVFEIHTRKT